MTRPSKPFAQPSPGTSTLAKKPCRAVQIVLVALLCAPAARAQLPSWNPQPAISATPTPPGAIGPTDAGLTITAFDIVVRTPPQFTDLRELIERHIELQRYRAVTDLDDSELARLIVLAEGNVRNLVGTLGYFSPDIRITREGDTNQRPVIAIAIAIH